jgi:hypothetical protein
LSVYRWVSAVDCRDLNSSVQAWIHGVRRRRGAAVSRSRRRGSTCLRLGAVGLAVRRVGRLWRQFGGFPSVLAVPTVVVAGNASALNGSFKAHEADFPTPRTGGLERHRRICFYPAAGWREEVSDSVLGLSKGTIPRDFDNKGIPTGRRSEVPELRAVACGVST